MYCSGGEWASKVVISLKDGSADTIIINKHEQELPEDEDEEE